MHPPVCYPVCPPQFYLKEMVDKRHTKITGHKKTVTEKERTSSKQIIPQFYSFYSPVYAHMTFSLRGSRYHDILIIQSVWLLL